MISKKDYALNYFDHDFIPIPLCWVEDGECACFHHHTDPKQIGKAPLFKYSGVNITRQMVEEWFTRYPNANIGIILARSELVIVDADSEEAVKEFEKSTWTELVPTVTTGNGKHYYFRANSDTPLHRAIKTGTSSKIDILSDGYIVSPPSVHRNGQEYVWSNPPKKTGLPSVPKRIEDLLIHETDIFPTEIHITNKEKVNLNDLPLNDFIKSIIKLGDLSPYYKQRGYLSKSEALFGAIVSCYEKGLADDQIFSIFTNPRYLLSYRNTQENRSERWLLKEMERAKAKKNSRSTKRLQANL